MSGSSYYKDSKEQLYTENVNIGIRHSLVSVGRNIVFPEAETCGVSHSCNLSSNRWERQGIRMIICPPIAERNTAHLGAMGVKDNSCKQK